MDSLVVSLNVIIMGVRLYPILKEGVSTAQFLGHDESVQSRLDELESRKESGEITMDDFFETLYSEGYEKENEVNGFNLFGWGKQLPHWAEDYCGSEENPELWVPYINAIDPSVDTNLMVGVQWG